MYVAVWIGIGIPGLLALICLWGRWVYGDEWHLALTRKYNSEDDEPVITRLNLK